MAPLPNWLQIVRSYKTPDENSITFEFRVRRSPELWCVLWKAANDNYRIRWYQKPLAAWLITKAWWRAGRGPTPAAR